MKRTWINGWLWLCLAALAVSQTACNLKRNEVPKLKISSWGDLKENAILSDLIAGFEKAHPGIQVELQRVPWNEYETKLLTQIAGNQAPDVICLETNNFASFYLRGVLEPLNPYAKSDQLSLGDYYPEAIDRFTMEGQTYVVPRDTAPIAVVYYNKKAFDEAGVPYPKDSWTTDEFIAAAQKVMKKDATGKV